MKKFLVAMFIAGLSVSAFGASCDAPELKGMIEGMKKSLPMKVDDVTTLKNVVCEKGSFKYSFDLNDGSGVEFSKFTDEQKKMFENMQTEILKKSYCEKMGELRKRTDSIVWKYDFNGKQILEVELKESDCK